MQKSKSGFTLVELLIVIVVIAILAAISIVAYNGVQERAKVSQANTDLRNLQKAILTAREATGKTLLQITGSNCTRCYNAAAYEQAIDRIGAAAGANIGYLKSGDPWGNPYGIDENEGENGNCNQDQLSITNASQHPGASSVILLSRSGYTGCS